MAGPLPVVFENFLMVFNRIEFDTFNGAGTMKTTEVERYEWLIEHGYVSYHNGKEYLSSRAVILIANLSGDAAYDVEYPQTRNGVAWLSRSTLQAMRRGANTLQAHYGTADPVTLLYEEAHRRAVDDTPL